VRVKLIVFSPLIPRSGEEGAAFKISIYDDALYIFEQIFDKSMLLYNRGMLLRSVFLAFSLP